MKDEDSEGNKILNYYMYYYFCVDLPTPNNKAHKGNTFIIDRLQFV